MNKKNEKDIVNKDMNISEEYQVCGPLQDLIGRHSIWLNLFSFALSVTILIGLFILASAIEYQGRSLLEILIAPILKFFNS